MPRSGRPLTYSDDIEQRLLSYILEQRDIQLAISMDDLCNLAWEEISQDHLEFKTSHHWADKFMARNDLVQGAKKNCTSWLGREDFLIPWLYKKNSCKRTSSTTDWLLTWTKPQSTSTWYRRKTVDSVVAKTICVRTTASDKWHLVIMLACAASGDITPPKVIFKEKRELARLPCSKGLGSEGTKRGLGQWENYVMMDQEDSVFFFLSLNGSVKQTSSQCQKMTIFFQNQY